jgi:hypothetical protein
MINSGFIDCSKPSVKRKISQIIAELKKGVAISDTLQVSNLLYNERYVDLLIAKCLGHKFNLETQGADAKTKNNRLVEYKCIVKKNGKYSGSFQFHWLSKKKIAKYQKCSYFYCAWRDGFKIEKIIRVDKDVLMKSIKKKKGEKGSTAGHKSFGHKQIEKLLLDNNAKLVYGK